MNHMAWRHTKCQSVNYTFYSLGGTPSTCKVYAVIKEEKVRNSDTLCGQYQRQKLVYTSMSDEIEIRIMEKFHHFFIKYEGEGIIRFY